MNSISLSQLTSQIQETIRMNFSSAVWVRAEISELRENQNGHCYLELIEKDQNSDNLQAKVKATIWSTTYKMLKPYFETETGQNLKAGINVLVAVTVEYNGLYGFSLNIKDIDPAFTVGELAARRLKIIRQLEKDGIATMNKELELPKRPQRVAIISSPNAAGFEDFLSQLNNQKRTFAFYTKLFPAIMQGDQAENSIIAALEKIYLNIDYFDVVVIIRGGGATTDLACFDSYLLALNSAQFPLPVITGIGHQRDTTIIDMVANLALKTPTAVAAFLIECMEQAEYKLLNVFDEIRNVISHKLELENQSLISMRWKLKQSLQRKFSGHTMLVEKQQIKLQNTVRGLLTAKRNQLEMIAKSIESHSPNYLLKHGYSITTVNGRRVFSVKDVKVDDKIKTILHDGDFEANVI